MTPGEVARRRAKKAPAAPAPFRLTTAFRPAGDQQGAIDALVLGDAAGKRPTRRATATIAAGGCR